MAPLLLEWGVPLTAVQVLGALFMSALTIALASMERVRAKFAQGIKTLEQENPLAFIAPDVSKFRHSYQLTLPKCGVVMPVKGVHGQSYANWRAQITSLYGGQLEFFFCVESEDDPAFPHIQRLQRENPEFRIHLCVAGRSWHCSQKIHNQLHGFELAMHSCHYVIVIDDDIQLHPGTIRAWVEEMETDATALLASGYAFEYVAKDVTSWTPYLWMLWRLCASTGFNHTVDRPTNCWGGALMYRASELQANVYGIIDAWRDGGYSEDFISLSLARLHRRTIAVPKAALFPSEVGDTPFFRFWNFVCRQVYVLTQTYATGAQRFIAIGAFFVNGFMHASIFLGAVATAAFALYIAYGLGRIALVRDASLRDVCDERCLAPACGAAFYCFGLVVFALAAKQCLTTFARLCNVLSPELPPIDVSHVKLSHLMIAYMIYAPIVPAATLTTLTSSSILWSGVRFTARAGRVISMHRMNEQGEWFTVPREKSLETAFRAITKRQVEHDPLLRSLAQ